jgi:predicted ATPase
MFDYIKIEGFRSFKKVELEMPRLAVLIGPNGGGKSNFLDLMSLMSEAAQGQLEKGVGIRGGADCVGFGFSSLRNVFVEFHFQGESLPNVRFKLGFDVAFATSNVQVEEVVEEPTTERNGQLSVVKRDRNECVFREGEIEERKTLEWASELAIFQVRDLSKYPTPYRLLSNIQEWTLYRDIDVGPESPVRQPELVRPAVRLLPDGRNLSSVLYAMQQDHEETWEDILGILKTAYPDFEKLRVPAGGGDGKVHLRWFERPHEKEGLSANLLSDGTLKLLCLIAILKSPNPPPLICIDEPELGLHPDWIELVAELLQDAAVRTQVIVATHSPHIVAKLDPDQVIVTEKENGETRLERLSSSDLEKWLRDFNLADLWLAGHIGGRP